MLDAPPRIAWLSMELPLFPLHVVLFPGRPLPLHVFEPRYRRLLADCLDGERRFGVVAIRSGVEVGAPAETFDVGTIARIEQVTPLEDGRFDLHTRGTQRFRIRRRLLDDPYPCADVELLDDAPLDEAAEARSGELREILVPYLASLGAPEELLARLPSSPRQLSYLAAAAVQVELTEQQRLLELDSTAERVEATLEMLRREAGIMRHFGTVGALRPHGPGGAQLN